MNAAYWVNFVVGALGGIGAVLAGSLWFGKTALRALLAKDLEAHKARLAAENEKSKMALSHSFQLMATEHSIRVQHLQAKRAEVLAELYKRLAIAARTVEGYVSSMQWTGEPTKDEKGKAVNTSIYDLAVYLDENKIFLPAALCDQIDDFLKEIRSAAIQFSVYRPHDLDNSPDHHRREAIKIWGKLDEKMRTEIPPIRRALEGELRKLIEFNAPE